MNKRAVPSLRERIAVAVYEVRGRNAASEALIDRVMAALASEGTPLRDWDAEREVAYRLGATLQEAALAGITLDARNRADLARLLASEGTPSSEGLREAIKHRTWIGPEQPGGEKRGLDPRSFTVHNIPSHFTEDSCEVCDALAATTDSPERLDVERLTQAANDSYSANGAWTYFRDIAERYARLTPSAPNIKEKRNEVLPDM